LAAYGVIAIHGSLVCSNVSPAVAWLQHSFDTFVVPYFLAVSFYFAARGFSLQEPFWPWLQKRGRRLLLPYVLWTVIYTGLQIAQALPRHDRTARLAEVMGDPTGRFFVGGAGMALYFLPLLFVGLLEMRLLSRWFSARSPAGPLLAGLLFSLVAAIWLHATHNGFSTTRQTAFQPLLMQAVGGPWATRLQEFPLSRLLLVVVADGIGCLPFLFLAWLTAGRPADELPPRTRLAVIAGALLVLLLASGLFLPCPPCCPVLRCCCWRSQ
jgi:fucose 4-O-acetylase-like acetyltransferase